MFVPFVVNSFRKARPSLSNINLGQKKSLRAVTYNHKTMLLTFATCKGGEAMQVDTSRR